VKKEIAALLVWYAKLEAGQVTAANGKKNHNKLISAKFGGVCLFLERCSAATDSIRSRETSGAGSSGSVRFTQTG
jgi:hypothetical protein